MKKKVALITGVTGQDGSYLLEILLKKNYIVHGIKRRSSSIATDRIDNFYRDPEFRKNFFIHYSDLLDTSSLIKIIGDIKPDEIYNLGAQSHVGVSFLNPEFTCNVNCLGTLRLLEAIRVNKLEKKTKFYQASSSEMFGNSKKKSQSENTRFDPVSPYATSKLFAYYITKNYRDAYKIFACNGILFNHESPRRGPFFFTQKVVKNLVSIKLKKSKYFYLGNLDAKRDWGHAKEYMYMAWKIMQQKKPDDFVISTGKTTTLRNFIKIVANILKIKIYFQGKGLHEKIYDENGKNIIKISKNYYRPQDVNYLRGNSRKAKKILNWEHKIKLPALINEMVKEEMKKY